MIRILQYLHYWDPFQRKKSRDVTGTPIVSKLSMNDIYMVLHIAEDSDFFKMHQQPLKPNSILSMYLSRLITILPISVFSMLLEPYGMYMCGFMDEG